MRVINAYSAQPDDIEPGDIMLFVVKAIMTQQGKYRLYRCFYEGLNVPQGSRIVNEREVCEALFSSLATVAEPDGT